MDVSARNSIAVAATAEKALEECRDISARLNATNLQIAAINTQLYELTQQYSMILSRLA